MMASSSKGETFAFCKVCCVDFSVAGVVFTKLRVIQIELMTNAMCIIYVFSCAWVL